MAIGAGGILLKVDVDERAVREVGELLQRLLQRTGDLTPVMKVIGETIRTSVVKNFEVGGRPPWIPTKPHSILIGRKIAGKDVTSKRGLPPSPAPPSSPHARGDGPTFALCLPLGQIFWHVLAVLDGIVGRLRC